MNTIKAATTYRVAFAPTRLPGAAKPDLNHILGLLCPGLWASSDRITEADSLIIAKRDIADAIAELNARPREWRWELQPFGLKRRALEKAMRQWLSESDPANDFIVLQWNF